MAGSMARAGPSVRHDHSYGTVEHSRYIDGSYREVVKGMWGKIAIALALAVGPAYATARDNCNTYPPEVATGYSNCVLRDAGEKPLWLAPVQRSVLQEIRFTFTEGHLAYTKIIHVTQRANGKASIHLRTLRRERDGNMVVTADKRRRLSAEEVAMIDQFGSSSGTWEHRIGSWDGGELFMHCETLDMERATSEGYSFASVNISCNQPQRLMPFVTYVTALVGLKPYADRQRF